MCKGTSVTFTAAPVNGGATPAYQWKKNGVNAGTNTAAWTTTGLNNSDVITCVMTSSIAGALNNPATSNAITANILSAPSVPVVTPAGPTTYCSGKNECTLSTVAVAGSSYQWYKGTTVINGATSNTYTPTATSSNTYKVAITNSVGCSKTSTTTAITVNANPASTITTTGPTTYCSGANACTLTANAGTGYTYQWYKGTAVISGATAVSYVPNATSSKTYKVAVTNPNGCSKTSSTVSITVNALPSATATAQGPTTFCAGDSVVLQANVNAGLTYQWIKGVNAISGATANKYTAKVAGTYKVRTTNANGCTKTSSPAITVTVNCREEGASLQAANSLNIFPNPGNGAFHLDYISGSSDDNIVQLEVLDMTGRVILSTRMMLENGAFAYTNDASDLLPAGIYLVRVTEEEQAITKKLIVE